MSDVQLTLLMVFSGIGLLTTAAAVTCLAAFLLQRYAMWRLLRRVARDPLLRGDIPMPPTDPAADQVWVQYERKWPL